MMRAVLRRFYRALWLMRYVLPISSKKVVVVSNYGRGYSDNPKYIINEMHKVRPDLQIYWATKASDDEKNLPSYVKPVRYKSIAYVYHMTTAKLWIDNCRKPAHEKKRSNQLYIQTWHAGNACMKRVERHAESKLTDVYVESAKHDANQTDLMVSGSKFTDDCYRDAFWYPDGEILSVGSPRNDIFFGDTSATVRKVRNSLGVDEDTQIALYAPTFRQDHTLNTYFLDFQKIIDGFESRFGGKWIVALRLHPNVASESNKLGIDTHNNVIDATHYDDMQELLAVSDALITDYSSSVFDYILTKKPTFILATDYDDYMNERGVYFDLKILPFLYSESEDKLCELIDKFDEDLYRKKCEEFMEKHKFYDDGQASPTVAEWISKELSQ